MSKYRAFDYEAQKWIEGEPARLLRIEQLSEELELLEGPNGRMYYASIRKADTPPMEECIRIAKAKLDEFRMDVPPSVHTMAAALANLLAAVKDIPEVAEDENLRECFELLDAYQAAYPTPPDVDDSTPCPQCGQVDCDAPSQRGCLPGEPSI